VIRAAVLALAFVLAACQAPIESPVTIGGEAAAYDARLPGLWYAVEGTGPDAFRISVLIAPRAGTDRLDVLVGYAEPGSEPAAAKDAWRRFGAFRATVWATRLLDRVVYVAERDPEVGHDYTTGRRKPGFILFTAAIDERGDLYLSGLSGDRIKKYGAGYGIHLIEEPIEGDDTYRLLDATENELRTLLVALGPALFSEVWGPLHRVADDGAPLEVKGLGGP
jgi:hypothetical protein